MNKPVGALHSAATPTAYRVRIAPVPTVVDLEGALVQKSRILEITFPGETVDTSSGPRNVVVGAGVAKILVGDITIRGVSLC